jgi:hypothetical protein
MDKFGDIGMAGFLKNYVGKPLLLMYVASAAAFAPEKPAYEKHIAPVAIQKQSKMQKKIDIDYSRIPVAKRLEYYKNMIAENVRRYKIGDKYDIPSDEIARSLYAIFSWESGFDHNSISETGDLGIGQTSPYAREKLRELKGKGKFDLWLNDSDYFKPEKSIRASSFWFKIALDEAEGDIDTAISAYNVGIKKAREMTPRALSYRDNVFRKQASINMLSQ